MSFFHLVFILLFCFSALGASGTKEGFLSMMADHFSTIPVQYNGRIMPFDTYARIQLKTFSGKDGLKDKNASEWLTGVLFDPETAENDLIFLVNNPEAVQALGIKPHKRRRYSAKDILGAGDELRRLAASNSNAKEPSPIYLELSRTFNSLQHFINLSSSLNFAVPFTEFAIQDSGIRNELGFSHTVKEHSFLDFYLKRRTIAMHAKRVLSVPSDQWSHQDQLYLHITKILYQWSRAHQDNSFSIFPMTTDNANLWRSPWQVINDTLHSKESFDTVFSDFSEMYKSFQRIDEKRFLRAFNSFNNYLQTFTSSDHAFRLNLEFLYNRTNPLFFAKLLYGIAFLLSILFFGIQKPLYKLSASILTLTALLVQASAIIARILISGRSPVSNMYETFISVAWISALLGMGIFYLKNFPLGLVLSTITGFLFLHIAGLYTDNTDTIGVLSAVLNSNFWLSTHVITIIVGYAGCLVAGILSHFYLMQRKFSRPDDTSCKETFSVVYGLFAFGITFTVIGTVLGGLWADQSWGRFWGWDPKENGALLIILWGAIVFHARLAGLIKKDGFAFASIFTIILVMFAWIGVNLLGLGLHTYGFSSSGAILLFGVTAFELIYMMVFVVLLKYKKKRVR
jgi:ABC-type transport system involved in cytochrome c biogenesis permease subunit